MSVMNILGIKKNLNMVIDVLSGRLYADGLKFDKKYLTISEIAQQFYCEHKLTLMYREGKVETDAMKLGTYIHEEVFKGEQVSRSELIDIVSTCRRAIVKMPLCITYRDVPILGVPDAIIFRDGEAVGVIELKTTKRWIGKVFTCEYVQAQLYAYMLVSNDISRNCDVVIIKVYRDLQITDTVREKLFNKVLNILEKYQDSEVEVRGSLYSIHVYGYEYSSFRYHDWALGYWFDTRGEYIPTDCRSRCRRCEYRHVCVYARSIL